MPDPGGVSTLDYVAGRAHIYLTPLVENTGPVPVTIVRVTPVGVTVPGSVRVIGSLPFNTDDPAERGPDGMDTIMLGVQPDSGSGWGSPQPVTGVTVDPKGTALHQGRAFLVEITPDPARETGVLRFDVEYAIGPLRFLTTAWGPLGTTVIMCPQDRPTAQDGCVADQPAFTLDLETGEQTTRVVVFDPEDLVIEAQPADAQEAAAALNSLTTSDIVAVRGRSDDWVVVGWLVTPCDRQAALTIATRVITVRLPPRPGCDAMAIPRVVALRMADPARAALFEVRLVDAPIVPEVEPPTPVAPPPTAEG